MWGQSVQSCVSLLGPLATNYQAWSYILAIVCSPSNAFQQRIVDAGFDQAVQSGCDLIPRKRKGDSRRNTYATGACMKEPGFTGSKSDAVRGDLKLRVLELAAVDLSRVSKC